MNILIDIKKITILALIIAAFVLGTWISKSSSSSSSSSSNDYYLVNKAVTENIGKHFIINFQSLKEELIKIQNKYNQKTYIYFNYLNNASWIGLNEKDEFTAASTIKVPLAMALFKAVEEGKLKLTDSYALEELDLDENFGELYKVGADKQFTVEELVRIMLEQSDNTAMLAIINIFEKIGINDPFAGGYEFMGWDGGNLELIPGIGENPNYQNINLKTLANMFLVLYNAKYVNIAHSQQILEYLTKTPFIDKIVAGVPGDVLVGHKIGVSVQDKTFSDCGIVYAPNRNYILCLGSNGGDEKQANKFMAEISRAVYQYIINN